MELHVLLFATFADVAGARTVRVEVTEPCTVAAMNRAVQRRLPALQAYDLQKILVAVNQEMAHPDQRISAGDEVGIFPPVSGGAGWQNNS